MVRDIRAASLNDDWLFISSHVSNYNQLMNESPEFRSQRGQGPHGSGSGLGEDGVGHHKLVIVGTVEIENISDDPDGSATVKRGTFLDQLWSNRVKGHRRSMTKQLNFFNNDCYTN